MKSPFRRLLTYLKRHLFALIMVFICVLVSTLSMLVGSYMIDPIITVIEKLARNGSGFTEFVSSMLPLVIGLGCVYIVSVIAYYVQAKIMLVISQKTIHRLRSDVFERLQALPVRYFDKHTHGELMSRFTNDVDVVSDFLNNSIISLSSSVLTIIGTLIFMLILSPALTIISVITIPLALITAQVIIKKSRLYFAEQQQSIGAMNGYIEEMMEGLRVVKTFCHEEKTIDGFKTYNAQYRQKAKQAQITSGLMIPLMQNISGLNYALTAAIGGILCITSGLSLGAIAAFMNLSRQFGRPLNDIASQFTAMQSALAGAVRLFEILDESPEDIAHGIIEVGGIQGHVVFNDVTFGYIPEKKILKHVTLEAKQGQKIALVGSTGAGKTTITNLLTRFYDIQEGVISIDDIDISNMSRIFLRKNIAMVLQDTLLFSGSVMENIRYGRLEARDDECVEAARLAYADDFIMQLPHGYQTVINGRGDDLSQGQRQLLNIARAAIANPAVLILDEATSSIDTRTEVYIGKGMNKLMEGRTTFVIAHRLSTVRNADCILVLEQGEIIERGSHEELLARGGRYAQLYQGQQV